MLAEGPMIDAHRVTLSAEDDFDGWRDAARGLAEAGVPPSAIAWQVSGGEQDLFAGPDTSPPPPGPSFAVPRGFVDLARKAILHSDPERFALLYAMLLKLRANRRAMEDRADLCSTGLSEWPRKCAVTRTRCTPSSASAKSRMRRDRGSSPFLSPTITSSGPKRAFSCAASPTCTGRS